MFLISSEKCSIQKLMYNMSQILKENLDLWDSKEGWEGIFPEDNSGKMVGDLDSPL